MLSTPFSEENKRARAFFEEQGLRFVGLAEKCDLFLGEGLPPSWYSLSQRLKLFLHYPGNARVLIWTAEPRYSQLTVSTMRWTRFQPPLHVMNVYTGDIYLDNFYAHWAIQGPLPHKELAECPQPGQARMVGMVGYVNAEPWMINGVDCDLNRLRIALLLEGHRRGRMDVYGRGWPAGISQADSRGGNWAEKKMATIAPYDICLAMENTTFGYYCTEKIWQAISGQCLPIYYGRGNNIYETFPRDSFLDAADFPDMPSLLDYIDQMPQQEFCDRYNRCVDVSNRALEEVDNPTIIRDRWMKTVERIRQIVGQ